MKTNRNSRALVIADASHDLCVGEAAVGHLSLPHLPHNHAVAKHIQLVVHFSVCVSFWWSVLWCALVQHKRLRMACDLREAEISHQQTVFFTLRFDLKHGFKKKDKNNKIIINSNQNNNK